jgi:hypothetical protein
MPSSMARLDAIEEGLAHGAQDIGNTLNGWKAFVATIQKGLRAMGLHELANHLEEASNAEVLAFLDQARRATYERRANRVAARFPHLRAASSVVYAARPATSSFLRRKEFEGNMTGDLARITPAGCGVAPAHRAATHPAHRGRGHRTAPGFGLTSHEGRD